MPTKALDDEGSGLEFEFYLAEKLGMIHAEMIERMSNAEFVRWTRYHMRKRQQQELERLASG